MSKIELMTHLVLGYRDFEETQDLVDIMLEKKVDYIEAQLAFSDPFGDGSTITQANQFVIDEGYTIPQLIDLLTQICNKSKVPVYTMTYINIAYKMGLLEFFDTLQRAGVSGLIIPDLPFLSQDKEILEALDYANKINLALVPVISPNITEQRLAQLVAKINPKNTHSLIYCTQRTGITGTHENQSKQLTTYLEMVRSNSLCKLSTGFGISSPEKLQNLIGLSDIAVIGSHILNLYTKKDINDKNKFDELEKFFDEINLIRANN